MFMFQEIVKVAPSVIQEAAKSPLGIVALSIFSVSVIGFLFFRNESTKVKISMFMLLAVSLVSFSVAILFANKSLETTEIKQKADSQDVETVTPTPKIPTPPQPKTPTPIPPATPITPAVGDQFTVEKNGVTYNLVDAKFEGNELFFWFIANNSGANKEMCLYYSSSLTDEFGNPHQKDDYISGKVRGGMDCFWIEVPNNVPTRFGVVFNTVLPSVKKIPLLTILIQKEGALEFRNINIPFSTKNKMFH